VAVAVVLVKPIIPRHDHYAYDYDLSTKFRKVKTDWILGVGNSVQEVPCF